jgi:biotin synthase
MAEALQLAGSLPIHGCSVSPFVPGEDTPLGLAPAHDANLALNCMAAMRLMRPDWVIPAVSALNLAEHDGYARGLAAGANLVTINMTPSDLREDYLIYKRDRFIITEERALASIDAAGLVPSTTGLVQWYRANLRGETLPAQA